MALKENYKDDQLNTAVNTKRRYTMTTNDDGTVSFDDATVYSQKGDLFSAQDINLTNTVVNGKLDKSMIVLADTDIGEGTSVEYPDGTLIFCKG